MKVSWLSILMTINKPNRTEWKDSSEEKIRYRKREQEEQEAKRALRDFIRHRKEEDGDDDGYPISPIQNYS